MQKDLTNDDRHKNPDILTATVGLFLWKDEDYKKIIIIISTISKNKFGYIRKSYYICNVKNN